MPITLPKNSLGRFYKIDAIPNNKEKNARDSLKIEAGEKIYVLIDLTFFGSAKDAFAICSSGIYWKEAETHYLSYPDLVKSTLETNSDGVLLIKSASLTYDIVGLKVYIGVVEFCNLIKNIIQIYQEEHQINVVEDFDKKIVKLLTSAKLSEFHNIFIPKDKEKMREFH